MTTAGTKMAPLPSEACPSRTRSAPRRSLDTLHRKAQVLQLLLQARLRT